jgi:hypothetical protein
MQISSPNDSNSTTGLILRIADQEQIHRIRAIVVRKL